MLEAAELLQHLRALRLDYQEQHNFSASAQMLDSPPSAIEALRMIQRSRPVIMRGYSPLTAKGKEVDWDSGQAYTSIMGETPVTIAVTQDGRADSVHPLPGGSLAFLKPLEEKLPMVELLTRLRDMHTQDVLYLQSQDGNIYRDPPRDENESELSAFQAYIQEDIPWMREATGSRAEAVNLWIGSSRSVTSFHHDPFENIYHVLSGSKTFVLVSPIEGLEFDQQFYPPATLIRTGLGDLFPRLDPSPAFEVPWVQADEPPGTAIAMTVTIRPGETLYLPAGWWHRVSQDPGPGGLAVAVNYWYPSETDIQISAYERFARRVARSAGVKGVIPVPGDDESIDDAQTGEVNSADEWDPSEWGR